MPSDTELLDMLIQLMAEGFYDFGFDLDNPVFRELDECADVRQMFKGSTPREALCNCILLKTRQRILGEPNG